MIKAKNKAFFLFFMVYISMLSTMTSTWVNRVLQWPILINQILTVFIYLPFVLMIIVKLVGDLKEYRSIIKRPIECIYYLFAFYYAIITGYRLLNGMEVKENLYYSIIFFGAIALYLLIRSKKIKISQSELVTNLLWVDIFFVLYRLIYCLVGVHFIENPPVNINLTSGAVAILTPFVANWLINECSTKRDKALGWLILCSNIVVVLTTGARAIFYLVVVIVGVSFLCNLNNRKGLLRAVSAVLVGCLVVAFLAMANVGEVRYSIYRQTGLTISAVNILDSSAENPSDSTENSVDPQKQLAEEQFSRSDYMRKDLLQRGIEQVKLNPLLGTGDVAYECQIGDYKAIQSSHNFLIEAIICYGCIGLVIIAGLFITLIVDTKLFRRETRTKCKSKIVLILTVLFYFAFGFVQPTVFNYIICPLFVLIVAVCRKSLLELSVESSN